MVRRKLFGTSGRGLPVDISQVRGVVDEGSRMVRRSREVLLAWRCWRSGSLCWASAMAWKSMTGSGPCVALIVILDEASAAVPLTKRMSEVN